MLIITVSALLPIALTTLVHFEPLERLNARLPTLTIPRRSRVLVAVLSRKRRAAPSFLDPRGGRAGRSPALGAQGVMRAELWPFRVALMRGVPAVPVDDAPP